ncbi:hypothetical protein [Thiomonas sp.]
MMRVLSTLTDQEWAALLEAEILDRALLRNPRAFTKEETLDIVRGLLALQIKIADAHREALGNELEEDWEFSYLTGNIVLDS